MVHKLTRRVINAIADNVGVVADKRCVVCDSPFKSFHGSQVCSDECATRVQRVKARRAGGWDTTRECVVCGTKFAAPYTGGKRTWFCSDECKAQKKRAERRIAKGRRKARMRGVDAESVDPFKVFDRDNWTCQICGVKTPRKLRGTYEPNAPELDHIVPLAADGSHTYDNVQCTCRACNGAKGAGVAHSQLRLELTA
jgi:5-methylcytosine-specific restriction endonuclease McrA